jgi:NAD-dependent dihydropyrimidine dehydrogenase PreA subunit
VAFAPRFQEAVSVSGAVLDADVVISLPKFKTHGLTVLTGAIKNSYGILPGAQKAQTHKVAGSPEAFHEAVVETFKIRPPDLFIMDAVVGMEGNGPASTELREIGLVLAADNAVAMDAVVAALMGLDPGRLRFLDKARADGLGDFDLETIEIIGDLTPIADFKVPPLGGEAILGNETIQELIRSKADLRPRVDPDRCTGCGTCVDQCPVEALSMVDDLPEADAETCITCFCCQEICPERAIVLE